MPQIMSIQAFYLLAFAAVHSLLASRQFKRLIWYIFGPGTDNWYMKFFSIFAAIALAPLLMLLLIFPGRRLYVMPSPWRWIMIGVQMLAGIGTLLAFQNAPHRFLLSQQLRQTVNFEPLQPKGIYSYVRDPFLLTGLIQMWFMPFMTSMLLILFR